MNILTLSCFSIICSELFSPDNLSVYLGILFLLSDFLRHAVWDVDHREYFSPTLCHHKMGTCCNWVVFTDQQFHPYSLFLKVKCPFMKWKKLIDTSFHSWFFFFWTVHIWYKVLSYTCYIFSPSLPFHCFSQVATSCTFTSETSLILLLPKSFLSKATKTISLENCGTQTRRNFCWRHTRRCSIGTLHFTPCPNFPTTLLKWPLKRDCTFCWQHSSGFEHLLFLKAENYSLASNKLQSTLYAIFTLYSTLYSL